MVLAFSVAVLVSIEDLRDSGVDKASVLSSYVIIKIKKKRIDCCRPRICVSIHADHGGGGRLGNVLRKTCVDYCAETEDKAVIRDI